MHDRTLRLLAAAALVGGCLGAAPAQAQVNPEEGGVWVPPADDTGTTDTGTSDPGASGSDTSGSGQPAWYQGGPTGQEPAEAPPEQPPASTSTAAPAAAAPAEQPGDGRSDHARMVGRVGVGYMGVTTVPIGSVDGGGLGLDTVSAPALGIRYWASELVGIDVGVGLGFLGGNAGGGGSSVPTDNAFAMLLHGGVPLALFHESHYKFVIIPEVNIGFSTGTAFGASSGQDRGRSGFLFQLGGRLGTEIHFGFMDIPQLTLQASVGLYFEYTSAGVGESNDGSIPDASVSQYGLGTTVQGEPWDILLGGLTALYYF
ncbi:MAG TPA: hypothetical protein RMH99_06990 [Sandaracinaceae bacterium LLY-WYZ-13_1]|nr:hypothetical protein [Sandaracinaceae bacterium LLY-WYZ-13_1]